MQIVRLNCAFSRNLGRGDDVDGLGAIMRGILKIIIFHILSFVNSAARCRIRRAKELVCRRMNPPSIPIANTAEEPIENQVFCKSQTVRTPLPTARQIAPVW